MPNCDFYAIGADHAELLSFVMEETGCQIFETYSSPGSEIRQFHKIDEIMCAYEEGQGQYKLLLNLYSPSMGGEFGFRRISLDKDKFGDNAFRYEAHGWGAIQLHLGGFHNERLHCSHTNHNSENRALQWADSISDLGSPATWYWREVSSISSRINRFIRKIAVEKQGSKPVLPAAFQWMNNGGKFD